MSFKSLVNSFPPPYKALSLHNEAYQSLCSLMHANMPNLQQQKFISTNICSWMLFNYNYFSDDKTIDKKNNYKSATIATLGFLDPKMCGKSYGKALSNKPKII